MVRAAMANGIDTVFGIPGAQIYPLFDAIHRLPGIKAVISRHEQGAGYMAMGYAKATGFDAHIARVFSGKSWLTIVAASLAGALSPFCSCGVIPLIAAMLATALRLLAYSATDIPWLVLVIQLLHVPADPAFAPVWPVAAHGALGTLFLLSGSVREAEERIRPVSDVIRRLPRARIFHVLLMQKGQRPTPEELQEKPSLLDDASLFLIQIEKGREAISLLRTMFARVMP